MDVASLFLLLLLPSVLATHHLDVVEFGPPHNETLFTVVVVCGLHPREAITRDVCNGWIDWLDAYDGPMRIRIVIVANANPSGTKLQNETCWRGNGRGVDLNRNWPLLDCEAYGDNGVVLLEEEWPSGAKPFSEWETQQLDHLLRVEMPQLLLAIHSGIEAILTPYDACDRSPINYIDHVKLGKWMRYGICDECVVSSAPRILYYARGTMTDYAYHVLGVPLVFTIEIYASNEPTSTEDCAKLFSPRENTPHWLDVVRRWKGLIKRLATVDADDFLTLLEMTDIVDRE